MRVIFLRTVYSINWRKGFVYGTAIVMEMCWLYALLSLLNTGAANGQLPVLMLLLVHPVAFGFNKLIQRLAWPRICLTILNWLAWAIVMLIIVKTQVFAGMEWTNPDWILALPAAIPQLIYTFKPELIILISSAILWWLGKWLASRHINFTTSIVEFQFGLVILVVFFLIASALKADLVDALPITLTFFCFALLGAAIAHAQGDKSWLSGANKFQWSWLLFGSIVVVLILGMVISLIISPDLLQLAVDGLKWLGRVAMKILAFIASLFPMQEPAAMLPPAANMPPMEPREEVLLWSIPESVRSWLSIGVGILWGGLIVVALWRISSQIYHWLQTRLSTTGAETEPLSGAFVADLAGWVKRILHSLSGLKLLSRLFRRAGVFPPEAISVHQIYRRLLHWGAAGGYARHTAQTANEYLSTLADIIPQAQEDLSFITHHYVSTRYGNSIPSTTELLELRQGWKRVKQNHFKKASN